MNSETGNRELTTDKTENFEFGQDDDGFDGFGDDHHNDGFDHEPILDPVEGFFKTEKTAQPVERLDKPVDNVGQAEPEENATGRLPSETSMGKNCREGASPSRKI